MISSSIVKEFDLIPTGPFLKTGMVKGNIEEQPEPVQEFAKAVQECAVAYRRDSATFEFGFYATLCPPDQRIWTGVQLVIWRAANSYKVGRESWGEFDKNPLSDRVTFYVNGKEVEVTPDLKGAPELIRYSEIDKVVSCSVEFDSLNQDVEHLSLKKGDRIRARILPLCRYSDLRFSFDAKIDRQLQQARELEAKVHQAQAQAQAEEELAEFKQCEENCIKLQCNSVAFAFFFNKEAKEWKLRKIKANQDGSISLSAVPGCSWKIDHTSDWRTCTLEFEFQDMKPWLYKLNRKMLRIVKRCEKIRNSDVLSK